MRPRPAEIGEHAITHQLGDVAEPADLDSDRVLKRVQHLAHGFRIEFQRQRRRVRQVDEHDGQLTPLGLTPPLGLVFPDWCRAAQSPDRFEQFASRSDW